MTNITIREEQVDDVVIVLSTIEEFENVYTVPSLRNGWKDFARLVLVGYCNDKPAGCLVSYDAYHDRSLYCWLVGVVPAFRGHGVMKALMEYQDQWARSHGYTSIKIKTRNDRREMLTYLLKYSYDVIGVSSPSSVPAAGMRKMVNSVLAKIMKWLSRAVYTKKSSPAENRIMLEKQL